MNSKAIVLRQQKIIKHDYQSPAIKVAELRTLYISLKEIINSKYNCSEFVLGKIIDFYA